MSTSTLLHANPPPALPMDVRLMNSTATLLAALLVFGLAALLLAWAARLPAFAIRGIRVEGDVTRNSVSTIRANALPKLAGSFFTMDLRQAQRAFESVPWVRRAVVKREWPNRLAVRLEEYRAGRAVGRRRGREPARQRLRRGVRRQPRRRRGRPPADAAGPRRQRAADARDAAPPGAGVRAARRAASRRSRCRRAARGASSSTAAPRSNSAAAATTR